MSYLSFINSREVSTLIVGSSLEEITQLEIELGYKIPAALREYLMLMGEKPIYSEYDYHGTRDMRHILEWINEWIDIYRNRGIPLDEIGIVLPFDKFQDTFFYIPIEGGSENPPVYALDINDMPEIRKINDCFTDFVQLKYNQFLASKNH